MDNRVIIITYFFTILSLICAATLENDTNKDAPEIANKNESPSNHGLLQNAESGKSENSPRKWISQLFLEAELAFEMDSNVNAACKKDFDLYQSHLKNQSTWAVRMLDSSEWPTAGISTGVVARFGNYDECLAISAYNIKGQYCMVEAIYHFSDTLQNEIVEVPDLKISAWETILMYQQNPIKVDRKKLNFALCVPSSCKPNDLKISLNSTLYPIFKNHDLDIIVDVSPTFCKIQKEPTYSEGHFIVRWFFMAIFLLLIFSTCYDTAMNADQGQMETSKPNTSFREVFKAFSVIRNFRNLKKVNPNTDHAPLYFAKVINIFFIIYGHRFLYFYGFPKFNAEDAEQQYNISSIELFHFTVVDVFLAVTGFLCFYTGLAPIMKWGGLQVFINVVTRWARMVPVFGILMLYIIYILPYSSEGPMWEHKAMNEANNCKESWWASFLIINNFVKVDQQCLLVSWYISVDIQLAILGGILLLIYTKNKKVGILAAIFTFIAFTGITFTVAYINQFHGILMLYMNVLENPRNEKEFTHFYIATYKRVGPYLLGFMAGIAVKFFQDREFKFTEKQTYLISFLSILIGEGSQYYGWLFYTFNREYNRFENALYAAVNNSLFVLAYMVSCSLYFTSGLGIFNKLVEWKVWVPFGRLSYSVFLVNTVIQLYHTASQKQPMPVLGKTNLVWWAFGDVVWCYVIGLIFYLFVEAPISNLTKSLKRQLMKKLVKQKQNGCTNIEKIDSSVSAEETNYDKISHANCVKLNQLISESSR